jgi:predicted DNA-binding WGR domain protein
MSDQKKLKTFHRREDAKETKKKIAFAKRKPAELDFGQESE